MIDEESFREKQVVNIIHVVSGNILNFNQKSKEVDAVVNAAKPTLMGGSGVDGAIHGEMDRILRNNGKSFNDQIKEEVDGTTESSSDKIRCRPGEAVKTKGSEEFVKYIIHAVGPKYDGGSECIRTLQKCYESIMKIIISEPDINTVAIPLIGSGNYGFPIKLAFQIALTTIGNSLISCKNTDYDAYSKIKKIYIVVFDERTSENKMIEKVYQQNRKLLEQERRMVNVGALTLQCAYAKEIWKYDRKRRHYFTITKMLRLILVLARFIFPSIFVHAWVDRRGWHFRRELLELGAIIYAIIPGGIALLFWTLKTLNAPLAYPGSWILNLGCGICAFVMADTVTYLLSLVFLADIQEPSANELRTLILLIFNYLEMITCTAVFYYACLWDKISFGAALDYSVFGNIYELEAYNGILRGITYTKYGVDFLFVALSFAFIVGHLKPRRFLSSGASE